MSQKFQLFRLSLLTHAQASIFAVYPEPTRTAYLTRVFSEERKFLHYKNEFYFEPAPASFSPGALLGRLGRLVQSDENLSPEEGLIETIHEGWKACVVVIDPTDHEDGQKDQGKNGH